MSRTSRSPGGGAGHGAFPRIWDCRHAGSNIPFVAVIQTLSWLPLCAVHQGYKNQPLQAANLRLIWDGMANINADLEVPTPAVIAWFGQ